MSVAVGYLVFAQQSEPEVDLGGLVVNTRRYFDATVEVVGREGRRARLRLEHAGETATFDVTARQATDDDLSRARSAELAGKAAGMAALAARCGAVWDIVPHPGASERAVLVLCALLASVALGPVLPPDGSTLFGVRGALARAGARHL